MQEIKEPNQPPNHFPYLFLDQKGIDPIKMFPPANDAMMGSSLVFLKLAMLPKLNQAILQGLFQGKDGMILVGDKLYSLKQSEQRLQEILVTEENSVAIAQIKSWFVDEQCVLISKATDFLLAMSLLDDGLPLAAAHRA